MASRVVSSVAGALERKCEQAGFDAVEDFFHRQIEASLQRGAQTLIAIGLTAG